MSTEQQRIFDDFQVDCNECKHYWDSSCDGVPIENKRNCTSFIATRTYDIPEQIKWLRDELRALQTTIRVLGIVILIHLIGEIIESLC